LDQSFEIAGGIGDARQHGSADDTRIHARQIELTHRFQAKVGTRRARLKNAGEIGVHGGNRDIHEQTVVLANLAQQGRVPHDEIGLGDNAEFEPAMAGEFFEEGASDFVAALGGLIRIRRGPDGDLLTLLDLFQFAAQQVGGVQLDEDLALEVEVGHLHELVGVTRVAVFAGEFAAAVRVDGPGERQIAIADHAIEQGTGGQGEVLDVVSLADGLTLGSEACDANELGFFWLGEKGERGHIRFLFAIG